MENAPHNAQLPPRRARRRTGRHARTTLGPTLTPAAPVPPVARPVAPPVTPVPPVAPPPANPGALPHIGTPRPAPSISAPAQISLPQATYPPRSLAPANQPTPVNTPVQTKSPMRLNPTALIVPELTPPGAATTQLPPPKTVPTPAPTDRLRPQQINKSTPLSAPPSRSPARRSAAPRIPSLSPGRPPLPCTTRRLSHAQARPGPLRKRATITYLGAVALSIITLAGASMLAISKLALADTPAESKPAVQAVNNNAPLPLPSTLPTATPAPKAASSAFPASAMTSTKIPQSASGTTVAVPGSQSSPRSGQAYTFDVQVEQGLPVDASVFADTVFRVFNDPRGWGFDGSKKFERVHSNGRIHIILASPALVDKLCYPLETEGYTSCSNGSNVVINVLRWAQASPEYLNSPGASLDNYRIYVLNHELGHSLGRGHDYCAGPGQTASVMQQQTGGSTPCRVNGWPSENS